MKKLNLKLTTPERVVLEREVTQLTLPTRAGEITILPDHVPYLTVVKPGVIEAREGKEVFPIATSGGFLEFHDNHVTILVDTAERVEEIDLERAEKARKRAEELKSEQRKAFDEEQYAAVISQVEKQLARIKAAKKYTPRSSRGVSLDD